jgi:hypothetical protein
MGRRTSRGRSSLAEGLTNLYFQIPVSYRRFPDLNMMAQRLPNLCSDWVVQALGAILFLISGLGKLSGDQMIQSLAAIGMIPALSGIGAFLLFQS